MMPGPIRPSRLAEWLVALTAPAADRLQILGDLSEEFLAIAHETSVGGSAVLLIIKSLTQCKMVQLYTRG